MPRHVDYASGVPCWIDRITADPSGTEAFYAALFGWDFQDEGGYRTAQLDAGIIAGFGSAPTPREFWTVYLAAAELDSTAAQVVALGGTVLMAPMAAGENGRLFLATDPGGTPVGFWEGHRAEGVVLVDEAGAACRYELRVPDAALAGKFYGGLFGYELTRRDGRITLDLDGVPYVDVVDDAGSGPHWLVYFGVEDVVTAVRRTLSCGARILNQNGDGSLVLADPRGARFGLLQSP